MWKTKNTGKYVVLLPKHVRPMEAKMQEPLRTQWRCQMASGYGTSVDPLCPVGYRFERVLRMCLGLYTIFGSRCHRLTAFISLHGSLLRAQNNNVRLASLYKQFQNN